MKILINRKLPEPIYVQIYDSIVEAIATGELIPGDTLPSSRKLAKDLQINYITVNKSYSLLVSEGFLATENKKVKVMKPTESSRNDFLERWKSTEKLMLREAKAKRIDQKKIVDLLKELMDSLQ